MWLQTRSSEFESPPCITNFWKFYFQVKRGGNKTVTAYILFASQNRKAVSDENKNSSFGDISRIVGEKVNFRNKFVYILFAFFYSHVTRKWAKAACVQVTKFSPRKFGCGLSPKWPTEISRKLAEKSEIRSLTNMPENCCRKILAQKSMKFLFKFSHFPCGPLHC